MVSSLTNLTAAVQNLPIKLQQFVIAVITHSRDDLDEAFDSSPAEKVIDPIGPAEVTWSAEWRCLHQAIGHSTWEELNTGAVVQIRQRSPLNNYVFYTSPKADEPRALVVTGSLRTAYSVASLAISAVSARHHADFIGERPADLAKEVESGDEYRVPTLQRITLDSLEVNPDMVPRTDVTVPISSQPTSLSV